MSIDVARISRDWCMRPGGPVVRWPQEAPLALDLGTQLAPGCCSWALGLDWGPWHFERAQLAAGGLICIPRKFTTATPQRRVRGSCGGPVEPREFIDTRRTLLATSLSLSTFWCRFLIVHHPVWLQSFAKYSVRYLNVDVPCRRLELKTSICRDYYHSWGKFEWIYTFLHVHIACDFLAPGTYGHNHQIKHELPLMRLLAFPTACSACCLVLSVVTTIHTDKGRSNWLGDVTSPWVEKSVRTQYVFSAACDNI